MYDPDQPRGTDGKWVPVAEVGASHDGQTFDRLASVNIGLHFGNNPERATEYMKTLPKSLRARAYIDSAPVWPQKEKSSSIWVTAHFKEGPAQGKKNEVGAARIGKFLDQHQWKLVHKDVYGYIADEKVFLNSLNANRKKK